MCPICITTAALWVTASASAGGVVATAFLGFKSQKAPASGLHEGDALSHTVEVRPLSEEEEEAKP